MAVGDGATGVGVIVAATGAAVIVVALVAIGVAAGVDTKRASRLTVIQLTAIQTMANRPGKWQNLRVRIQPPSRIRFAIVF